MEQERDRDIQHETMNGWMDGWMDGWMRNCTIRTMDENSWNDEHRSK